MMERASVFMAETLDNILSIQKIEDGKFDLELQEFSISLVLSELTSIYGGVLKDHSITVQSHIDATVPKLVVGDAHRISHVLSNLLSNAIKFSPRHSMISFRVSCDAVTKTQVNGMQAVKSPGNLSGQVAHIRISVQDEGPGISKEDQEKLFCDFVQIRPGKLQKGRGSGLGLHFCKQIVTMHGGSIEVESTPGSGR